MELNLLPTPRHIIGVDDFDLDLLHQLFEVARDERARFRSMKKWRDRRNYRPLDGATAASLFYQPSTRTRFSFEQAMRLLGGQVTTTESAGLFSSAKKGESLVDTVKIACGYLFDVIILRHDDEDSALHASSCSAIPVINAGAGQGEHPTQALLDLFSIIEMCNTDTPLTITFVGDLQSRVVHSNLRLLERVNNRMLEIAKLNLVSPDDMRLEEHISASLNAPHRVLSKLTPDVLAASDVVYSTRTQDPGQARRNGNGAAYALTNEQADTMPEHGIILHPLPRVAELPEEVDRNNRARYFDQAANGLWIRMALLQHVLN